MKFLDLHGPYSPAFYLKFLAEQNQIEVRTIVEIGVWKGENAYVLRHLFPDAHFYLIDPWKLTKDYVEKGGPPSEVQEDYDYLYKVVKAVYKDDAQVSVIRKTSIEGAKDVPDEVDLVFIDGNHDYDAVKEDIATWRKKVRKGGILSGHDFQRDFPGVMRAVDESLKGKYIVGNGGVWATIYHHS